MKTGYTTGVFAGQIPHRSGSARTNIAYGCKNWGVKNWGFKTCGFKSLNRAICANFALFFACFDGLARRIAPLHEVMI